MAAFNDGFLDGLCREVTYEDGAKMIEDGAGNLCQQAGSRPKESK
ncbi:hypothetical protein [Streptomyces sp. URMC 123]